MAGVILTCACTIVAALITAYCGNVGYVHRALRKADLFHKMYDMANCAKDDLLIERLRADAFKTLERKYFHTNLSQVFYVTIIAVSSCSAILVSYASGKVGQAGWAEWTIESAAISIVVNVAIFEIVKRFPKKDWNIFYKLALNEKKVRENIEDAQKIIDESRVVLCKPTNYEAFRSSKRAKREHLEAQQPENDSAQKVACDEKQNVVDRFEKHL